MTSRVYDTVVTHARTENLTNVFRYRSSWWLIDVEHPPQVPRLLRGLVSFEARDHLGDPRRSIADNVRTHLADEGVDDVDGSITLLTTPRSLGNAFNPLSLYWCRRADGTLAAVLAEVHNTYGGRHVYTVRPDDRGRADGIRKEFYVSPFYTVEGEYTMSVPEPGDRLAVSITLHRDGAPPFVASVRGVGQVADAATIARTVLRTPVEWLRTLALIHLQGIRLWRRGLPTISRPARDEVPHDHLSSSELQELPLPFTIDKNRWPDVAREPGGSVRTLAARAFVGPMMARLPLRVVDPARRPRHAGGLPEIVINRRRSLFRRLGTGGTTGFGEGYMAGDWDSPDLAGLLTVFADRLTTLVPAPLQRLRRLVAPPIPPEHRGTTDRVQPNIAAHYDLSNELFETFLDPTLTYSSGLYDGDVGPGDGGPEDLAALTRAQARKVTSILDLAQVGPGTRLLEIGTGWGELAIAAARRGAQVETITLSVEQARGAQGKIDAAGLSDLITVRVQDYRATTGRYDAVVSVEMIEAVGSEFWPVYFRTLSDRLGRGGRAVVQAIVMPHDRMLVTRTAFTWVQKYIFPGGFLPSRRVIDVEAARAGMDVVDSRAFGQDYARTLATWRARFEAAHEQVSRLGFDEVFRRMWSFYLAYSEAGFGSGYLDVQQVAMRRR